MLKSFTLCLISLVCYSSLFAQFPESIIISTPIDTHAIQNELRTAHSIMKKDPLNAHKIASHALELSLKANYGDGTRGSLYNLMAISQQQKSPKSILYFADLLIANCNTFEHKTFICDALLLKGIAYINLEHFDQAIESLQKALFYAPDKEKVAYVYGNISTVMAGIGQYDKAMEYLEKAIKTTPNKNSIWLSNKAYGYLRLSDYKNALLYIDSAYYAADNLEAKANVLFRKIIIQTENKDREAAIEHFNKFKHLLSDISPERKALLYLSVSQAYFGMKDYKNTQKYLFAANDLKFYLNNNDQRRLLHQLSELYYATKNYKKAFDLHKLSHKLEDSVKSKDVLFKVNELETKFRTAEKDKAIAEQKAIISKNKEQRLKDRVLGASIFVALIFLLLLLWVRYYYLRQKNQKLLSEKEINRLQAMMEGEEKERTRLSHELHDGVNSSLAATTSYLQTMEQLYPEMSGTEPFIKVKQLLESTSSEVRAVAHNLAPHILMKNGLKYAIEDFCANLFPRDVAVEVQSFGDEQYLPKDTALFMYRIAQELLHNVHKHAQASEVIVALGILEQEVSFTIEDNGVGMHNNGEKKSGIGLDNLKERVRSYNGEVTVESAPGKGTVVYVLVRFET